LNSVSHVWKTHSYIILFIVGMLAAFIALYFTASYVWPFLLGLVLAYMLLPVVKLIDRVLPFKTWQKGRRTLVIILLFLIILGLIILLTFLSVTALVATSSTLFSGSTDVIAQFIAKMQELTDSIRAHVPEGIRASLDSTFLGAGTNIGDTVGNTISSSLSGFLNSAIKIVIGLIAVPVFLFYLLKDTNQLKTDFYAACSLRTGKHIQSIIGILERVLGRFVRAELTLGLVVGGASLIGLLALGAPFALPLAFIAGLGEMIPMVGPWISGGVAVIVMIALAPDLVIWVAILYLGIQLLENMLLVPKIQGSFLHIHPAIAIMLLFIAGYAFGFLGVILVIPLTATVVEITKYLNRVWKCEDNRLVSIEEAARRKILEKPESPLQ